jgi:hypothetical protein
MDELSPGRGIWFSERQRDESTKVVPGIVLWVGQNRPVLVVARGTSQLNDQFCSDEDAVIIAPSDPSGIRLELALITQFRADDVKLIAVEAVTKRCPRMTRDVWKRVDALTREAGERARPPDVPDISEHSTPS